MNKTKKKTINLFERKPTILKTCLCGHNEKFSDNVKKPKKKKLKPEKLFIY